ncbi:MAG: hypothetical protein M3N10_08965, partial [Actinomycetota bacterium]|nr:hypothetical protein [Actinomycetota bacterium]
KPFRGVHRHENSHLITHTGKIPYKLVYVYDSGGTYLVLLSCIVGNQRLEVERFCVLIHRDWALNYRARE